MVNDSFPEKKGESFFNVHVYMFLIFLGFMILVFGGVVFDKFMVSDGESFCNGKNLSYYGDEKHLYYCFVDGVNYAMINESIRVFDGLSKKESEVLS